MRTGIAVFAVLMVVIVLFATSLAYAGGLSSYEEAMNYIGNNKWEQAKAILAQEVADLAKEKGKANRNKLADVHFWLGVCHLNTGNVYEADANFQSAIGLKPSYGDKIGGEYKNAGLRYLRIGKISDAKESFKKALTYEPALRKHIAEECLNYAVSYLSWQKDTAEELLNLAIEYDYEITEKACVAYYAPGDQIGDEKCLDLYPANPISYCGTNNERVGNRILEIAKRLARIPRKEAETARHKETAIHFLGKRVADELPEVRYYGEGEHIFGAFKTGEQTPFWFGTKIGTFSIELMTTNGNRNYTVVTNKGERFHMWNGEENKMFANRHGENNLFKIEFQEDMEFGWKLEKI